MATKYTFYNNVVFARPFIPIIIPETSFRPLGAHIAACHKLAKQYDCRVTLQKAGDYRFIQAYEHDDLTPTPDLPTLLTAYFYNPS